MGNGSSAEDALKVGNMGRLREDMKLYRLADMHGGGELIPWMRYAQRSGDHSIIDGYIDVKVAEFLYNLGKGKLVAVTELVKMRNKERNERLGAFSRKKGKGKSGPNILDDFNQENANAGDLKKALKLLDGGGKGGRNESKYREVAWKTDERGSMGETLLGVCLLQGTDIHNKLALKILDAFPKLINDINMSEDYYGLSLLHQAVVNQDQRMVWILLKRGADVNQRCYGAFFCADDQKASRTDSLEHEYVELSLKTNYTGSMYFGEYPLSFAACMNHPDCYRLLIAFKANPNAQDTNGNTVLHLCVIHENLDMFRIAVETGASLRVANKQKLTPLTLAAKMAKRKMFLEILSMEGDVVWEYSVSSQTAYPLVKIDTINETDGSMNDESALALVVYGETAAHLDLLDGLLEELLECKWQAYGRMSWFKSFTFFCIYYAFFFAAFMTRPFSETTKDITLGLIGMNGYNNDSISEHCYERADGYKFERKETMCHLLDYRNLPFVNGYLRLVCESVVAFLVIAQIFLDSRDIRRIGRAKWLNIYKAFPARLSYKMSYVLVLAIIPMRLLCGYSDFFLVTDNVLANLAVMMTTVHFLYFCRAIKFVGPFVLMIYTIIATDIFRFLLIYSIFLIGFSQSFYIIFTSCQRENDILKAAGNQVGREFDNIMQSPIDALIRTFIMTIGEFMVLYRELAACPVDLMRNIGKAVFLVFELCVSILQFNLLIAMMTRTYEAIFLTRKEWKRQWAQVILMLELSLSPHERLTALLSYSRPTGTNKKARSFVERNMEEFEAEAHAEKQKGLKEEKRQLMRRKRIEAEAAGRPMTSYLRA